jgi:hypothetical protein
MIEHSPQPSPDRDSHPLAALSKETLVVYLADSLDKLEALCLPLPSYEHQRLLWFHPHEYEMVNSLWNSRGISGVMSEWGETRTFASGKSLDIWSQPSSLTHRLPPKPAILHVLDYGFDTSREGREAAQYRAATFTLTDAQKHEFIETLSHVGLLERVIPIVDDVTDAALGGAPIVNVACVAKSRPSHSLPGGRRTDLTLSLTIAPPAREEEVVSLHLDTCGQLGRTMLVQSLIETGYEGHGHKMFTLSSEELRALLSLLSTLSSSSTQSNIPFQIGHWLYHSLP